MLALLKPKKKPQATFRRWGFKMRERRMQVEVNAKHVLVNGNPLLSMKGMEYLVYYKFSANIDHYLSLTLLKNNVSMCALTLHGDSVQIVGCPRDQISLFINYDGLEH